MELKRPFSDKDWEATPVPVREYIVFLEQTVIRLAETVEKLEKRIIKLESQFNKNSQNSNKPPSSDLPFKKAGKLQQKKKENKRQRGGQNGHAGYRQELLTPTDTHKIMPGKCKCGCSKIKKESLRPYYTHQVIELPEVIMEIIHYILLEGKCAHCGKTVKAGVPGRNQSGYGPRLSAMIAELSGSHGASRETVQDFCKSVLGFHISTGAIQSVVDRSSDALEPVYNHIGNVARSITVNYIDETSWRRSGRLNWLWTMANEAVAFFKVHKNRSKEAFESLIEDWKGILVSDGYGTYKKWIYGRQACLAHYIRKAKGLSESNDESIRQFGESIKKELQLLCHFAHEPPGRKKWENFYSRFILLLILYEGADDEAGDLARGLGREMDSLWTFLEEDGVEPTNNRAERALRFGVLWRKRSKGTQSDKGNRWVERILTFKQTCRIKGIATFPLLVDIIGNYFKEQNPDLSWI